MQTFLPFADFARTAEVLDDRRLGKQRVETLQILRALHLQDYGWANHPAVLMWRGHTAALVTYGLAMVAEWTGRGRPDTTATNIAEFVHPHRPQSQAELAAADLLPGWLGDVSLHRSHCSALVRKDPGHYRRWFLDVPDDLEYVWPEPPAPASPRGRRSAWVVWAPVVPGRILLPGQPGEWPWTPLDARSGRITKRLRQVARFVEAMQPGDLLVVPDSDRLHLAAVDGDHRYEDAAHIRPVRWIGERERHDLAFPAALQDPQDVFELFDETVLER